MHSQQLAEAYGAGAGGGGGSSSALGAIFGGGGGSGSSSREDLLGESGGGGGGIALSEELISVLSEDKHRLLLAEVGRSISRWQCGASGVAPFTTRT